MDNDETTYRVVFFDLDGTLLPMDMNVFLSKYYRKLEDFVVEHGFDGKTFVNALNTAVRAMITHDDGRINSEVFWETFLPLARASADEWQKILDEFYEEEFGTIGDGIVPDSDVVEAVEILKEKGYPLVLATMPLFPEKAIRWRLQWAGLNPDDFVRLTTYENSRSAKPKFSYYAENIGAAHVLGSEVLMVGNNVDEDTPILDLGGDIYLILNQLLNPSKKNYSKAKHGSRKEFAEWVRSLPQCEDPATDVDTEAIPLETREMVMLVNGGFSQGVAKESAAIAQAMGKRANGNG